MLGAPVPVLLLLLFGIAPVAGSCSLRRIVSYLLLGIIVPSR
jgi:hypothetical protein